MIRGTNQPFQFRVPYDLSEIDEVRITFWQEDNNGTEDCILPMTKTKNMCVLDEDSRTISVTLNQVETLAFKVDSKAYVQLRAITVDGFVFATREQPITVYPIKDDMIMG